MRISCASAPQACTFRDALGGGARLGRDLVVCRRPRDLPLLVRLGGVEEAALQQDLRRDRGADQPRQRQQFLVLRHHQPWILERRAEAAGGAQRRMSHSAAIPKPPPTQIP